MSTKFAIKNPDFLTASQVAEYLGISPSYFYKLRTTAPHLVPPALTGITKRIVWSKRMVDYWLAVREEKTKLIIEAELKKVDEDRPKKKAGRPRKSLIMGDCK